MRVSERRRNRVPRLGVVFRKTQFWGVILWGMTLFAVVLSSSISDDTVLSYFESEVRRNSKCTVLIESKSELGAISQILLFALHVNPSIFQTP